MLRVGIGRYIESEGAGIRSSTTHPTVGAERSDTADEPAREPRCTDSIDLLSRRLDDVCTRAVDSLQIAAALEADGMSDRVAVERYDRADVFALAEDLYDRVPLRVMHITAPEDMDEVPAWRDLSRGVLFVLPGALYVAAVHGFTSRAATYALLVSLIFAWVWGQGSGYLGHILIGRKAFGAARRLVISFAAAGIALATFLSWAAATALGLNSEIVVATALQTTYLLAASMLLLFRKEHVLFAILIPGVVVSSLIAFGGESIDSGRSLVIVVTATILVVAAAAVETTRSERDIDSAELTRADMFNAIPHVALALAWASLVSFGALVTLDGVGGNSSIGVAILPLLLSMGVAEWSLRRYLKLSRQALEETTDVDSFAAAARRTMWSTVSGYTLVVVTLTGVAAGLINLFAELSAVDLLMMIAFAQLGAAFLLGQILASRLRLGEAVVISMAAVVLLVGLIFGVGGVLESVGVEVAYLASTLFLALTLLGRSWTTVGKATTYR